MNIRRVFICTLRVTLGRVFVVLFYSSNPQSGAGVLLDMVWRVQQRAGSPSLGGEAARGPSGPPHHSQPKTVGAKTLETSVFFPFFFPRIVLSLRHCPPSTKSIHVFSGQHTAKCVLSLL